VARVKVKTSKTAVISVAIIVIDHVFRGHAHDADGATLIYWFGRIRTPVSYRNVAMSAPDHPIISGGDELRGLRSVSSTCRDPKFGVKV